MKILALLLLLMPALAGAQAYQSPATVAKRLKEQCAKLAPAQRPECEKKARSEVRASIAKHHELKRAGPGKQAAKSRDAFPKTDRKSPQTVIMKTPAPPKGN